MEENIIKILDFFNLIIMQNIWNFELLLRMILACILGMLIGFERRHKNKMAGIRTHAIVAFGAALMMIVSKYGFGDMSSYDASRIASQIVSGIGFLGAGQYFVGISGGILLVLLQELLHRVGFLSNEAVRTRVQLVMDRDGSIHNLEQFVSKEGIEIKSIKINQSNIEDTKVEMELLFTPNNDKTEFLNRLLDYPEVTSVCG